MFLIRKGNRNQRPLTSLYIILFIFLFFSTGYAKGNIQKSLLILHSYHPSLSWTDSVMKGMQEALIQSGESVQLHVDYMDTRRYSGMEYRKKMEALLLHKLANEHFDLVLLSDNDALDFLLAHRMRISTNAPIIFCGINHFTESTIAGHRRITGLAEEVSLHETIDTALKLHPGTKEIIVIGRTVLPADRANREAFLSLLQSYKQAVKFTFWDDLSANELRKRLPSLQRGSLVFINGLTSDETGRQLLYDETTRLIRESSSIPLYSLWDVYLGYGIIGGKLVSGYLQGKLAGELAVRVLRGEDPDKIPVIRREAANKFIFDYHELSRFGLSVKNLPNGSEVINTPSSFYAVNKMYIWGGIVFLLIFACIIVSLGINILAKKRAEEAAQRLAKEETVMAEIGRIISSTLDIDEVYMRFAEEAHKLIPFDGIAINIINHKEGIVTVPYVSGIGVPGCQPGDVLPLEDSVTGMVAHTHSSLIIQMNDKNELQIRFPTLLTAFEAGLRTVTVVPLISKDQAIGAIHFRSAKPNAYLEQHLQLAERIADQIAGAIANAQLFIERKQAEEALRESERRFLVFMEHLPTCVFIKDQVGRLLFANRYLQETFGWKEFVGKTTEELLPREMAEQMIADDRRVLTEGPIVIQEKIIDIRGEEHFFNTYKFPIPAEGTPLLLGGIAVDITERIKAEKELANTKVLLQSAFEQTPVPMVLVRAPDGVFLNVNRACVEMLGVEDEGNPMKQSLMGFNQTWQDLDAEGRRVPRAEMPLALALQGVTTRNREFCVLRKDGTRRWEIASAAPIYNEAGERIAALAVFPDITEQKRTEEALRQSETKYRRLYETMMDAFVSVDMNGRIQEANRAYQAMLSYSEEELRQLSYMDLTPEKWHALEETIVEKQILVQEHSEVYEKEYRRKDGVIFPVELRTFLMRDDAGKPVGMWAIVRDITERKQVEETLRQSEKKYRSVIENIQDVFYRSDSSGTLLMGSPSGAKMFGYDTIDEMIGIPLDSFWPDSKDREQLLAQVKATGSVKDFEAVLKRKDGSTFNASFTTHFYYDDNGNFLGTEGIIRDITERKRAEEERSKLEAQMREVQKLESLGVLAGGIAHDFNNLLMPILGNADLALLSLSPASPARHNIEEIVKASQRAADLCHQMLAYSGKGRFVLGRYDLSEIVHEMAHMLQVSISKKATLHYRFAKGLPAVEADATQLRQVVMNLITNASDALGDESGVIEVSSGVMECDQAYLSESYVDDKLPEGRYVYLEVSDTGCGMDAETHSRIFDPFFTTKFMGQGLGLAAVLGIVRGHKGAIKVYSEPGKGTTFKILLPAVEWMPTDRVPIAEQSTLPPSGGTVLLVDDDESVLHVASSMLDRLGFTVLTARDGQEGLEVFREQAAEIDCVLLDLTMPHLNGEQVFREMRRIRSDIRVILSSGYNEQDVTQRFIGKGLAGFVQKPYTLANLREVLNRVLG